MISQAPFQDAVSERGNITPSWAQWFTKVGLFAGSVSDSGTTANRPTKNLFIGRPYFDTTLNKPIWVKTVTTVVWVDATGASV